MSNDFNNVLLLDPRLEGSRDGKINFAVKSGAQNISQVNYNAVSQGTSSHTYNVTVPSQSVLIDRYVEWATDFTFRINFNAPIALNAARTAQFQYGITEAFAAFPLNSMVTTMSATINSTTVSQNQRDLMPMFLQMLDEETMRELNSGCPTARDNYFQFEDAIQAINNPLGGWADTRTYQTGRGTFKLKSVKWVASNGDSSVDYTCQADLTGSYPGGTTLIGLQVTANIVEPLMISPFLFTKCENQHALYGVSNMNFVMNLGSLESSYSVANKYLDATNTPTDRAAYTYTPHKFENSTLRFTFLTPNPSQLLSSRCVLPYYEIPRYITNIGTKLPVDGTDVNVSTNTLQLNSVPDMLFIYVRPVGKTVYEPDVFAVINSVSINFNNNSGLLSSADSFELYKMSKKNGLVSTYDEWRGRGNIVKSQLGGGNAPFATASPASNLAREVPLCGSMLVLSMGTDVQISDQYFAPGSLGNFNLQIKLNVSCQQTAVNPTGQIPDAGGLPARTRGINLDGQRDWEIVLATYNAGVFISEKGSSSNYIGVLGREQVLKAQEQTPIEHPLLGRKLGGSLFDTIKGVVKTIATPVTSALSTVAPVVHLADQGLRYVGYGKNDPSTYGNGTTGGMSLKSRMKKK